MSAPLKQKTMTVDEFIPWVMAQPRGRYELINGEVVMMSPERAAHVRTKTSTHMALATALARAGFSCEALGDGMTVSEPPTSLMRSFIVVRACRAMPSRYQTRYLSSRWRRPGQALLTLAQSFEAISRFRVCATT
jgi:Putative restriction endonuclease